MENQNDFRDPVFKQLAAINGKINLMSRHELVVQLSQFHLDNKGTTDMLKKRLKNYYKQKKLKKAGLLDRIHHTHFDCLCVIDFEATCETINAGYKHEIIEFPAVLVNVRSQQIIDTFHSFCRPVVNPNLSFFCMQLTGIEQEQVSKAKTFPEVLRDFESWMAKHMLGKMFNYAIVTDGPWDMAKFLSQQCKLSRIKFPNFGKKWINISKTYSNFYRTKRLPLAAMLKNSGLEFEGKPHSGLDDTYNIARIVLRMLKDGAPLKINEHIHNNSLTTRNQRPPNSRQEPGRSFPDSTLKELSDNNLGVDPEVSETVFLMANCRIRNKTYS